MLPVDSGGHTAYQDFVVTNLRKYYPDSLSCSTWVIIDHFWNLDLSFIDECLKDQYSKYGSRVVQILHKILLSVASIKYGCSCEHPCSDSKYGRTVHVAIKDNPLVIQYTAP